VLINLPGESSSVVTALDGYRMAQQGRAGAALATAAGASFFAGTVAAFIVAFLAPPLAGVALQFQAPEYFSLLVLGLIASVVLAQGSLLKALGMVVLGLLLSLIGTDVTSGTSRFAFDVPELRDGVKFVVVAMGVFGVAEIVRNLERESARQVLATRISSLMPTREDVGRIVAPILRGTALGSLLGILPGGGALLASFASYALEKKVSPRSAEFGKGAIEGVAAPEAANNAGAQTSFIPMLTLGIPSNPVMALMIGALILQGIRPGPNVMLEQPRLFWGVIVSMWIGNLFLLVMNLPLIGLWVRVLAVPYHLLYPAILVFATVGVLSLSNATFDVHLMALFGVFGYVLAKLDCEPAPLLLGYILGPLMEEYLRRAMTLSRGDPTIFLQRPISAAMLVVAVLAVAAALLPAVNRTRAKAFAE
jgi:TctA family transporter